MCVCLARLNALTLALSHLTHTHTHTYTHTQTHTYIYILPQGLSDMAGKTNVRDVLKHVHALSGQLSVRASQEKVASLEKMFIGNVKVCACVCV